MDKKILIIGGGSISQPFLQKIAKEENFFLILAVDGGVSMAEQCGITVDYLVGDFDTISQEQYQAYTQKALQTGLPIIRKFRAEKDETDMEIAILTATELEATEILIVGATGTRLDHTYANIHLLKKANDLGVAALILDEHNKIYLTDGQVVLHKNTVYGKYISLIPLTDKVDGVTLTGFQYPLTDASLSIGSSLGVSNEITEEEAVISVKKGLLIVFETKD